MKKNKILVVDDEEQIRHLFTDALGEMGYVCDTASDGLECLDKYISQKDFDIVLLDVQMPELNGIETLRKLKACSPDISVIMVSASRDIEHVRIAMKEGAYDYIFKPFNIAEVETVINRVSERAELLKENSDYQINLEKRVRKQTMISALDLREHETGYHSYRVTEYALNLGKRMGLNDDELSVLAKAALLHDIGKIGVPDEILLKPDRLTESEWDIMKKHSRLGYELLQKIDFLGDSASIVLYHHERYDGTGYPEGLSGEEIPLGARIFSVIDALDALTSDRSYRKGVSFETARNVIKKASGTQFDPAVVDVFMSIDCSEWESIKQRVIDSGSEYLKELLFEITR